MQFHGVSQRCSSTARPNSDVLRCDPTPHLRQHFNPISSPESAARHAWATLPRLSVARKHSGRPFREQNAAFHSRDNLGRPFREQIAPFRSRDNLGRPSREQIALFRSLDNLGRHSREQNTPFRSRDILGRLFREQNAPSRSRDILGRPFREQNAPSRSRDNLGRPSREQIAAFHSRDCRERHTRQPRRFFSELRGLHGNSTGALWALLDAAEVRPEPVGLVIGLSAFRNRHLDG